MRRLVTLMALLVFVLTPVVGVRADTSKDTVFAEEYQQARQAWLQNHKELGRAVESANVAAVGLVKLVLGHPTCAQLERVSTFPFRNVLSQSRVTIETMKKVLGLEQRMDNMDEVRRLEVVMRMYHENNSNVYEVLTRVVLKKAEVCGGGEEANGRPAGRPFLNASGGRIRIPRVLQFRRLAAWAVSGTWPRASIIPPA